MSKPPSLQRTIERAVSDLVSPEKMIPHLVAKAASKRGLALSELEIGRLSEAILLAEGDSINVDLDTPCGFGTTEADAREEIQALVTEMLVSASEFEMDLTDAISGALQNSLKETAAVVGEHLSRQALEHAQELKRTHQHRVDMVQRVWGEAFKQLDILRELVVEWGYMAGEFRTGTYAQPTTAFALNRLFLRAHEIVGEILVLVRSGYADGALARWRSLHEVCIVAVYLGQRTEKCAEMYLAHHCIEELRVLQIGTVSGTTKNSNSQHDRYLRILRARKVALVSKYGPAYANDNGWAAVDLNRSRVTLKDLENYVGLDFLRNGYQRANSTVHGGALAALTRVSLGTALVDNQQIPPAYGCETAVNFAASSLSMLIVQLAGKSENADLVAIMMVIVEIASTIRGAIRDMETEMAGNTPRARMLERRATQRKMLSKPHPRFRR